MTPLDIAFWVLAIVGVTAALMVVLQRDIFRAALSLVLSLLAVAGLFVLLNAEFLAVVQVLIYVGAIAILIIFAIMLTRNAHQGNPSNRFQLPALALAALVLAAIVFVVVNTPWNQWNPEVLPGGSDEVARSDETEVLTARFSALEEGIKAVFGNATPVIARLLLRDFVLPMEVASVVLLAAVIGALALVREREGES